MQQRTFRAMGTDIELFVAASDADDLLSEAEAEFHRLESVLSRFREDSELATLNRDGAIDASPDLLQVTRLALAARELTAGRFDPTVHDAVVAAGYDRTFELVPGDVPSRGAAACGGRVRIFGSGIQLARGVRLDFGGIGKGYAAERAATILAPAGPCLVNAGGDVAVRDGVWPVGVETAGGSVTLELSGGALRRRGATGAAGAATVRSGTT